MLARSIPFLCTLLVAQTSLVLSAGAEGLAPRQRPSDTEQFCKSAVPSAEEIRIGAQVQKLRDLNTKIENRMAELAKAQAEASEWIRRREALLHAASDSLTAIYAKMSPDSAAAQLGAMDDDLAASILTKLNPRVASAIMSEMDAAKAGRLVALLSGTEKGKKL